MPPGPALACRLLGVGVALQTHVMALGRWVNMSMPDRYDELMQRRSMLLAEARRHMRNFQERIRATNSKVDVRFE
jgi:hypothetical protein